MTNLKKGILILSIGWTIILTAASCQDKYVRQKILIDRIDTSGVYVTYTLIDKKFSKRFELDVTSENFSESDTMVIKINETDPEDIKFESIIHRKWPKEDVLLELNTN